MKFSIFFISILSLAGCATMNHDVKEVGENKFTVSAVGNSFASADTVFNSALDAGKEFCAKRGKKFELLDNNGSSMVSGGSVSGTGIVGSNAEQRIFFTCK